MVQKVSPFLEVNYGWALGESGWNSGMDDNLTKFSFLVDGNIDGIVSTLPAPVNGTVYYLTTDKRLYYVVENTYRQSPTPLWKNITLRSTGQIYQFNGTDLLEIDYQTPTDVEQAIQEAKDYTDALEDELAVNSSSSQGAYQVGFKGRTVGDRLSDWVSLNDYTSLSDAVATQKKVTIPTGATVPVIGSTDSVGVLQNLRNISSDSPVTLRLSGEVHTTNSGNICNVSPLNSSIRIEGATPISTTLTSVASVSGTSGNYSVVLNLTSAAGIAVGNYLKLDNVVPLLTLSGDNSVFRIRVAQNELLKKSALLGNITATTGGGSASWATVNSGVLSDYISVGDLLTIKGQTRPVATVGSTSVSITGAWSLGVTASRDYLLSRPNSGTVSTAGVDSTTVTGTSSLFTTEANVGDMLLADGKMVLITAIASNTSMTVSPAINLAASTPYSIITSAVAHEGTHEVTNVSGNQVTVINKWRGAYAPPVNRVSGGEVKCISTVLKNTGGGDGFFFEENACLSFINNLVIVSTFSSSGTHGLALNGRAAEGPTQIGPVAKVSCGDGIAICGWGRGAFLGLGCELQARRSHFVANNAFNIWCLESSILAIRECVITSAVNGRGVYLNAGSTALITDAQVVGNNGDGLVLLDGCTVYGELPNFFANTGMNIRATGNSGLHVNEGVNALAGQSGIFGVAARMDISRCLFIANAREGIELSDGCNVMATGVYISGGRATAGSGRGIVNTNSRVIAPDMSAVGNAGAPVVNTGIMTTFDAATSWIRGTAGIVTTQSARTKLTGSKVESVTSSIGSYVLIDSVTPVPAIVGPARVNETSIDGSIVTDGAATATSFSVLKVNNGASVSKALQLQQAVNFGTVAANSSSSQTVTITGAAIGDMVSVSSATAALIPDGLYIDATVSAANTVTVRLQNRTAAGVAANPTLKFLVLGLS